MTLAIAAPVTNAPEELSSQLSEQLGAYPKAAASCRQVVPDMKFSPYWASVALSGALRVKSAGFKCPLTLGFLCKGQPPPR